MKSFNYLAVTFAACIIMAFTPHKPDPARQHLLAIRNTADLKDFFKYTSDRIPFISSHRGGPRKGFPENCIPTFENTMKYTWSIMEMDPHYTKDSSIVLMHDPTLNRTSNGTGKVSDYTLEELRKFKLKDTEGNLTSYGIPTFDEVLEWAKAKTILVVDAKDVPILVRAKKIQEHHAEANAIIIAYSFADAKLCYAFNKNIMMEVMMPDRAAVASFDSTGVPWQNVVAFVTHTAPADENIFQIIHDKGAMCIRGSSRTIDRKFTTEGSKDTAALVAGYHTIINSADVIEADLGIEAGQAIDQMKPAKSNKKKYFK